MNRTMRTIHFWISLILAVTALCTATTGLLLVVKKHFDVLQTPVAKAAPGLSNLSTQQMFNEARSHSGIAGATIDDVDRIDIRPSDGVAKVIFDNRVEVQIGLQTGKVLRTGFRTSDVIEDIHDFSFAGEAGKLVLGVGSALALLILWGTGTYLFVITLSARRKKRRKD
jgi:uncharacterized iron-regulated membrane protein